ncbi:hypothetical protein H5410_007669 [Solanum commersonii]|uniref:Alpha-L-fucosidase 2 n=1 Tax=Solanum commersonii TaxID=4109 RepID=A0A9J6ADM9_SOLCO|nr:hypothetical protein H5410_007669 [Solanum commersonii]
MLTTTMQPCNFMPLQRAMLSLKCLKVVSLLEKNVFPTMNSCKICVIDKCDFPIHFPSNKKGVLVACCGAGGPYNFMFSTICGDPAARNICSDTSVYASWDGMHFTEAAYKWIATGVLKGTFTFPPLPKICTDRFNPIVNQFYDSKLFGVSYQV